MLIKNGMIHDAVNRDAYEGDIRLCDGKIAEIGKDLQPADGEEVFDASGKQIYPGFVDAHSHLGLDNYGMGFEGHDYNEMGDMVACQLRGIDSFILRIRRSPWLSRAVSPQRVSDREAPMSWEAHSLQSRHTETVWTI